MGRSPSDPNAPFQPYDFVLAKPDFMCNMEPWREPVVVLRCRRSTATRSGWLVQVQNLRYQGPTNACADHFTKVPYKSPVQSPAQVPYKEFNRG